MHYGDYAVKCIHGYGRPPDRLGAGVLGRLAENRRHGGEVEPGEIELADARTLATVGAAEMKLDTGPGFIRCMPVLR